MGEVLPALIVSFLEKRINIIVSDKEYATVLARQALEFDNQLLHPILLGFKRRMVYQPETLFLAVDTLIAENDTNGNKSVIEVKVYPDKMELLIEAMHFVMHHFPAMQTTHHKTELMLIEG